MNNEEITTFLLDAGADPRVASQQGLTPLMVAADVNSTTVVSLLLNQVDVNAADKRYHTALHYAAKKVRIIFLFILLGTFRNCKPVSIGRC